MKKFALAGLAFTMTLNSAAFATGDRVSNIVRQTQTEREALIGDLNGKVTEARRQLAELKLVLPEVVAKRNRAAFASLGHMLGAAITGVLTVVLATKTPQFKGFLKAEAVIGTAVLGGMAALSTKLTHDTTVESSDLAEEELQIIADIKELEQDIEVLDAELVTLQQQLQ
ncbi:hypothetical protein D3C72_1374590 [compost metagenome]